MFPTHHDRSFGPIGGSVQGAGEQPGQLLKSTPRKGHLDQLIGCGVDVGRLPTAAGPLAVFNQANGGQQPKVGMSHRSVNREQLAYLVDGHPGRLLPETIDDKAPHGMEHREDLIFAADLLLGSHPVILEGQPPIKSWRSG
jgi:hypothetical protein